MKAIVAEIDKRQMIVITDKGDFVKVKRQMSAGIGDEIELKPQKIYPAYRRLASIAACFLACIFLSTGVYAYCTPYSYVSVDINPSIALSLNRFERVIAVNPLNEDAVNLIKGVKSLKNQDIDEALSEIIKSASDKGYIDNKTENQVMVVVSARNPKQEQKLENAVAKTAAKELSKVNENFGVMVEKTSVENYKTALSNKVSPGKEILADKLREIIPEIKDEEVKKMSMKEAVNLIKESKKAAKAAEKDSKNKEKDKEKDKDKGKDKGKKENAINNKDSEKKNGKEAASEVKDNKEKNDNTKPAASDKSNNGNKEKGDEIKAAKEKKDNPDKDSKAKDKDEKDKKGVKDKDKKNDDKNIKNEGNSKGKGNDKKGN